MTPGQRQMRADARRNYDRLLIAARAAFAEHGVDATLDDVAKRAGLGPGTLYRHFPTREALLAAVYMGDMQELADRSAELARTKEPAEALAAWLSAQVEMHARQRGLGMALKAMLGSDSETLAACKQIMRGALNMLLERAREVGAVRTDLSAEDILRLVHGVTLASETAPESASRLLSVVIEGLRPVN